MCLRRKASTYLEAVAATAATARVTRFEAGESGLMIRARMRAVMYVDSTFVGAWKIRANDQLARTDRATRKAADARMYKALNGSSPMPPNSAATATRAIRT